MLRKHLLRITPILLALLTAACAGAVPQTPTETPPAPTLPPATTAPTATHQPGCSVVSASYGPEALTNSPIPSINADDWTRGPEDAPVQLIEYGDFQ